jgi:hypothetical protein
MGEREADSEGEPNDHRPHHSDGTLIEMSKAEKCR